MTAVTIKFCIYVFLVENDILFTNKTLSPSEKKTKQLPFFNFKRNIVGKALFKFKVFLFFYWFQITLFCFNFHMSSFQACVFARIYVPLYIKAANECPPIQTCVFSLRDDGVLPKSVQEGTQLLMLPRILV